MTLPNRFPLACALVAWVALIALPGLAQAQAQATVKPDGQLRYAFGLGASLAKGNTDASSANITGDGVRADSNSKWQFGGKALWGESNGAKTAENEAFSTQYDRDINPEWFGFAKADALRDKLANVASRASLFGGAGRHVFKADALTFDLSAGLGYTQDRYVVPAEVADALRSKYSRAEALLAEESTHKWTPTTTLHQKLSLYKSLRDGGGYRGVFDSGLSVSMTSALSLTAGLNYRYDSDPGVGVKRGDTLFVTGVAVKID